MLDYPGFTVKQPHALPHAPVLGLIRAPVAQLNRAAASEATYCIRNQQLRVVQIPLEEG